MKQVPQIVKDAAKGLTAMYGDSFRHLGKYQGSDAWLFAFPEDVETGFPVIFFLEDGKVKEVSGFQALSIVRSLLKD